jgi:hypothetical protein
MGHIRASPTTTSSLHHNQTLESLEQSQIRVRGSQTHSHEETLHPQFSDREYLSRPPQLVDGGYQRCNVGHFFGGAYLEWIPKMKRSPQPTPPRNTTALRHKNSPVPHQGPRHTPPPGLLYKAGTLTTPSPHVKVAII